MIKRLKSILVRLLNEFLIDNFPKYVLSKVWYEKMDYQIDWNNPCTLNEKIQWLILYSDTTMWTRLTDKIRVRDFVAEKGLKELLIPLLGYWDDPRDINFDKLPDKFVLKCNHDSASVKVVDKNKGYNYDELIKHFDDKLKIKFGYLNCEPHYNHIKPLILAEEFVELDSVGISSTPIDYKVFCFSGKPHIILVTYNRDSENGTLDTAVYDINWIYRKDYSKFTNHYRDGGNIIPRPKSLNEMIKAATILSEGLPQVRVDFYDVNGKLYFGEMTFTSDCGRMPYFSDEFQRKAGSLIDLSLAKTKSCKHK